MFPWKKRKYKIGVISQQRGNFSLSIRNDNLFTKDKRKIGFTGRMKRDPVTK